MTKFPMLHLETKRALWYCFCYIKIISRGQHPFVVSETNLDSNSTNSSNLNYFLTFINVHHAKQHTYFVLQFIDFKTEI